MKTKTKVGNSKLAAKNKGKNRVKVLISALLFMLLVIGALSVVYLIQFSQDLRQQASMYDCPFTAPFGSCDPTPSTPANECTGTFVQTACTQAYQVWRCGNENWIPDYENPNATCGGCPWPVAPGGVCCPTSVDACPTSGAIMCNAANGTVSECTLWSTKCPAGKQNYYRVIDWCIGEGCECDMFAGYSGTGCDC